MSYWKAYKENPENQRLALLKMEELKESIKANEKYQEEKRKKEAEERLKEREKKKKMLEEKAKMRSIDPMIMPEYKELVEGEKGKKAQKKGKKARRKNPRKNLPKKSSNSRVVDQLGENQKLEKILTIKELAPEGIRGLCEGGRRIFHNLFSKMKIEMIPTKRGSNGVGNRICVDAYLTEMAHFVNEFKMVPRRDFIVSYLPQAYPYTGAAYKQFVWEFKEMETFQKFLSSFVNFTPCWEVLWVRDFHQPSVFVRVDNPEQSEHKYLVDFSKKENKKKRKAFHMKHLSTKVTKTQRLRIVLGEVASNKKRISTAKLVYTINLEPDLVGGQLKLSLNHEVSDGGKSCGGKVSGVSEAGEGVHRNGENCIKNVKEITGQSITATTMGITEN